MNKLIQHLSNCVTDERLTQFEKVLSQRTSYITVVLENIFQPLNASAVLRSCDCFGIQNIHIIEDRNEFNPDREVAMGSSNWLNIKRHKQKKGLSDCISKLKSQGYRIIATTPHSKNSIKLKDFKLEDGKTALLFGTELTGLSEEALNMADVHLNVPMFGFTESFNLSVCAAICLNEMKQQLNNSDLDWKLSQEERDKVMLSWLKHSIERSEIVVEDFLKNRC